MRTVALLSVLAVAACSSNGGGNAAGSGGAAGGPSGGAAAASGVDVMNACAALPRDAVQQAVGLPLKSAELADVTPDTGSGMASSGCVYDFGGARLVQLRLQKLPDGTDGASVHAGGRDMQAQGGQPVEDVRGLGQNAFYVARPNHQQLSVQVDGSRNALLSFDRLADVPDPKGKMIALAHRVVG